MSELKLSNYISMDFLDKYSYLNKQIVASTEQNKALIEEITTLRFKESRHAKFREQCKIYFIGDSGPIKEHNV